VDVPGWDSRNDCDGYVDDDEFGNLVNPNATHALSVSFEVKIKKV